METKIINGVKYYKILSKDILVELPKVLPKSSSVKWLTQHWTAGRYEQPFTDYQVLVDDDYILVSQNVLNYMQHQHTWKRNGNNIGLSYMAMFKNFPITTPMIENMSKAVAVLVKNFKLTWQQVVDHDFFSKIDGYDSLRSDVSILSYKDTETKKINKVSENLLERSIRKAKWYYGKLK